MTRPPFLTTITRKVTRKKYTILIIVIMVLLSVLPLMGLGTFSFVLSRRIIVSNYRSAVSATLQTSSVVMNTTLENIVTMARIIFADEDLQDELAGEKSNEDPPYFRAASSEIFRSVLSRFYREALDIEAIYLYDLTGRLYYYSKSTLTSGLYLTANVDDISSTEWYEEAKKNKGMEIFVGYDVIDRTSSTGAFSCVKLIRDIATFDDLGFLIINYRTDSLGNAFGYGDDPGGYLIVDDRKSDHPALVYASGDGEGTLFSGELPSDYLGELTRQGFEHSAHRNGMSGWNIVHIIRRTDLVQDVSAMRYATLAFAASMAIASIATGLLTFRRVSRPLNSLEKVINDVARGERHIKEQFDNDEIGIIGNQLKKMVRDNLELNEKVIAATLQKREAEFQALQAQINPHFLFNTLDAVYWFSKMKKTEEVSRITACLSEILRHVLNDGQELATVETEIRHTENYLQIQGLRFQRRFQYEIRVAPAILQNRILKLLIQPFVENALVHGIEPLTRPGSLAIRGYRQNDSLIFEISDNGVGMESVETAPMGIGIRNVQDRIKLYYGQEYGVRIESRKGHGTTIFLSVPSQFEDK